MNLKKSRHFCTESRDRKETTKKSLEKSKASSRKFRVKTILKAASVETFRFANLDHFKLSASKSEPLKN